MSLRGDFRAHEHGQVMLPFLVLRCLECALAPTKVAVVKKSESLAGRVDNVEPALATEAVRPTRETTVIQRVPLLLGIRVWDRSTPIALPLETGADSPLRTQRGRKIHTHRRLGVRRLGHSRTVACRASLRFRGDSDGWQAET